MSMHSLNLFQLQLRALLLLYYKYYASPSPSSIPRPSCQQYDTR